MLWPVTIRYAVRYVARYVFVTFRYGLGVTFRYGVRVTIRYGQASRFEAVSALPICVGQGRSGAAHFEVVKESSAFVRDQREDFAEKFQDRICHTRPRSDRGILIPGRGSGCLTRPCERHPKPRRCPARGPLCAVYRIESR